MNIKASLEVIFQKKRCDYHDKSRRKELLKKQELLLQTLGLEILRQVHEAEQVQLLLDQVNFELLCCHVIMFNLTEDPEGDHLHFRHSSLCRGPFKSNNNR